LRFFLWRFCAFLNKGSSKTPLKTFWENPCQKLLAEKVEKKKTFFLSSFPMAFLCVSQPGEFKSTIKNFLGKVHVKNWPKKLRKKIFFLSSFPIDFFYRVFGRFSA
jgi:hypothetical protein